MVDVSAVSMIVASVSVLVAATYYIMQIRHQNKLRQTDMVMRLYALFGSVEFQNSYQKIMGLKFEDYVKRYAKSNVDVLAATYSVGVFFEGIGVLVKRKLINMDLVDDLFTIPILDAWEK